MSVESRPAATSVRQERTDAAYEVTSAPAAVHASAHRAALDVLRAELATVWLDAAPGGGAWAADVGPEAALIHRRVRAERAAGLPGRPGRGPETVALDPQLDDDFAAACALAAGSRAVEAMSRQGRVVLARLAPHDPLRLRLTPAQHDDLVAAVPGLARHLVRRAVPVDRPSRGSGLVGRLLSRWRPA